MEEQIETLERSLDAVTRLVELGPLGLAFMVILLVIVLAGFGVMWIRFQAADKKLDHENVKEMRALRIATQETGAKMAAQTAAMRENNEDNYLALRTQIDRLAHISGNVLEAVAALAKTVTEMAQQHADDVRQIRNGVREEMQTALLDYVEITASQRATTLAGAKFQFPPDGDCRWETMMLTPVDDRTVHIHSIPLWNDNNVVDRLRRQGEVLHVIEHTTLAGWYAVARKDKSARGWIYSQFVTVKQLRPEDDTRAKA